MLHKEMLTKQGAACALLSQLNGQRESLLAPYEFFARRASARKNSSAMDL